jgi:hypothetical protein
MLMTFLSRARMKACGKLCREKKDRPAAVFPKAH